MRKKGFLVIRKGTFDAVITQLMWVSRETLDKDRLLERDELLEYARKIMDYLEVDYTAVCGE